MNRVTHNTITLRIERLPVLIPMMLSMGPWGSFLSFLVNQNAVKLGQLNTDRKKVIKKREKPAIIKRSPCVRRIKYNLLSFRFKR